MFGFTKLAAAGVAALVLLSSQASAQCVAPTGFGGSPWIAEGGAVYNMRRVGSSVFWIDKSADDGRTFTNVFHGTLSGNIIQGEWADLFGNSGSGGLTLRVDGEVGVGIHAIDQIASTGDGFGSFHWIKPCNDTN
jgi:hypothetical protein